MNDAETGERLIYFIKSYMDVSEITATFLRLHKHSLGQGNQKVRELIGQVEEEVRKFVFAGRKYYFNNKSTGIIPNPTYFPQNNT